MLVFERQRFKRSGQRHALGRWLTSNHRSFPTHRASVDALSVLFVEPVADRPDCTLPTLRSDQPGTMNAPNSSPSTSWRRSPSTILTELSGASVEISEKTEVFFEVFSGDNVSSCNWSDSEFFLLIHFDVQSVLTISNGLHRADGVAAAFSAAGHSRAASGMSALVRSSPCRYRFRLRCCRSCVELVFVVALLRTLFENIREITGFPD